MAKSGKMPAAAMSLILSLALCLQSGISAQAGDTDSRTSQLRGGIAAVLTPGRVSAEEVVSETAREMNFEVQLVQETQTESKLVMTDVALNVRSEANGDSERVGMLYKGCGGTILDRRDGWTKIQSGNIIGWCSDEYLLFGEEAQAMANDVGKLVAVIKTESLRVRQAPDKTADTYGLLPEGEMIDVVNQDTEGWICVNYKGNDAYVSADYVSLDFVIAVGETSAEIKARELAEEEAKRHVKYGEYLTDADTLMLLAALIHCEARGESYEGQVAVGAVVMNRVRSASFPNTIHGVIFAPGQFTPAMGGLVTEVYESGKINQSCIDAAKEALSGVSNVGDRLFFRRNNGRDGLVIGNHVFY